MKSVRIVVDDMKALDRHFFSVISSAKPSSSVSVYSKRSTEIIDTQGLCRIQREIDVPIRMDMEIISN